MLISSRMVVGSKPDIGTLIELYETMEVTPGKPIGFMVFETQYNGKTVHCCLSGGELMADGEPRFTLIGLGALESLINLPTGKKGPLIFQEVKIGRTPVKEKMFETFKRAPDGSKICFIGDLQGELDGVMLPVLNLIPEIVNVAN